MIDTIVNNDITETETEELNQKANKAEKPEEDAAVIQTYKDIICIKKKNIISIAYHQGKVFKQSKDKGKFIKQVMEFKVHKSTIIFKINIVKLIDKHPKLIKSSTTLRFLKNYYKDIKQFVKNIQMSLNR